jgi:hypothetical protein
MNYKQPEISVLGDVAQVVRRSLDKTPVTAEQIGPQTFAQTPAYDLDE